MNIKQLINTQLESYEKSFARTKDFEEFKANIYKIVQDIEEITPVTPFYSSSLFQMKLDCENMDRMNASQVVLSIRNFLERLNQ
jgi:hypothetical protein